MRIVIECQINLKVCEILNGVKKLIDKFDHRYFESIFCLQLLIVMVQVMYCKSFSPSVNNLFLN